MWLVKKSGLGLVAPLGKQAELPGGVTVLSARLCSPSRGFPPPSLSCPVIFTALLARTLMCSENLMKQIFF